MSWSEGERQRERLAETYREMSDGELLELDAQRGDLTEVAQEALAGEMKRRGLEAADDEADEEDEVLDPEGSDEDESSGWRTLHVFQQTFEAEAAFRILKRQGVEFAVEDRTLDENGEPVPGPAVQLALLVEGTDWDRCVTLLRREAGLFPVAVVDPRGDGEVAEEEMVSVGEFEEEADAVAAKHALETAGVAFRTVTHDGEDWERTSIEVKSEDADRALAALERLLEGEAE